MSYDDGDFDGALERKFVRAAATSPQGQEEPPPPPPVAAEEPVSELAPDPAADPNETRRGGSSKRKVSHDPFDYSQTHRDLLFIWGNDQQKRSSGWPRELLDVFGVAGGEGQEEDMLFGSPVLDQLLTTDPANLNSTLYQLPAGAADTCVRGTTDIAFLHRLTPPHPQVRRDRPGRHGARQSDDGGRQPL